MQNTDDAIDVNATIRAPFYKDVLAFYGHQLDEAEWGRFCATLLRWAETLRSATASSRPHTPHLTAGWARRRNQGRRPPPSSLIQPSSQSTPPSDTATPNNTDASKRNHRSSGRQRSIAKARLLQRLYRTNPSVCVRKILDDTPSTYCTIPESELVTHFSTIYAAPPPLDIPPTWLISRSSEEDVLDAPFTPMEIQHQIRRAKKSAPGEDRLTYANWKWADPEGAILCTIFNICRESGRIPSDWKRSAVTLLPKGGDCTAVRNWRPICLQKTIYKLYSATIARRIADWAITSNAILPSQKGFLPYDGCVEHSFILRSILDDSRRSKRNVLVAWLDLRDAFGSVSHELMLLMMSRLGLCGKTLDIVADIYQGSTIAIKTGKESFTSDIPQQRDVKQGCPLSPLLFNIAIEGLLRHLASSPFGYHIGDKVAINHLAYADDVCVIAGSKMQGQALLDRCVEFTSWAGLTFNATKCGSICAINNVSPMYVDTNSLHLGNDIIPALTWRQRYKYLGCPVGAGSSHDLSAIKDSLLRDTERIMKSELAEWQKLDAYRRFLFPRLSYVLKIFFPGSLWCRKMDMSTRKWLKKAVCIPSRACSAFLYTPQSLGGLGVPCIEDEMHVTRVAQAFKFLADSWKRSSGKERVSLGQYHYQSINFPPSSTHLLHPRKVQAATSKAYGAQASFSTCLSEPSDYFTYSGAYLTFPQYRFALRARLNLLPMRTVQARCGKRLPDTRCRQCHLVPETLSHLVNHCLPNMGMIRARHNAVLERLIRAIPPSMGDKFKEQPLPDTVGANRPDLTIISPDGRSVILVDVCIPFEGAPEALHEAATAKVNKYEPLRQTLLGRFESVEVFPFVIGSLGSWFPPNDGVLKRLRIGHRYAALMRRLCVASAIAGSQDIWFHSACSRPNTNIPNRLQPDDPPSPITSLRQ
ncbi:hypothetical protein EMCRGX_G005537 [Ephydatia muelleri]